MKILIIANARYKGGLSGGDAIYESFKKYWPCDFDVWSCEGLDYNPFILSYCHRICVSIIRAIMERKNYDLVYSASDFLPDSIPAFIYARTRGIKWVAGFYLRAFKENRIHFITQKFVKWLIDKFSDMVIVTNPTMYDIFPNKKKTWINGGVDLKLAGLSDKPKIYDAVFCGRIHPSKGIDELLEIWDLVRESKPHAKLALIGDGDLGIDYIKHKLFAKHGLNKYNGITLFGYMGNERYEIYKQSKVVLYPTPLKYDHFSMAPVEAMACGCPMVYWKTPVIKAMIGFEGLTLVDIKTTGEKNIEEFAYEVLFQLRNPEIQSRIDFSLKYARQFDYEQQSLRVYQDIRRELHEDSGNRSKRNGRERTGANLKTI